MTEEVQMHVLEKFYQDRAALLKYTFLFPSSDNDVCLVDDVVFGQTQDYGFILAKSFRETLATVPPSQSISIPVM